ncbi:hypothetical protein [Rhizobium glycinendophyticum]|uniref:Uncharacterized protein n=1 Tax=Rhizobium glycinendophyticum TaxID=2589807 RepID=A0A504UBM4_9HYPH|nr:hypothetical protein [Rhizobium glycinendophyticum]TPP07036.1 hypothetical protein FJQ55_15350 [Rhizobium glycinendophyticum]
MASTSQRSTAEKSVIVERAVTRISDNASAVLDGPGEENATALLLYLVENGVSDEDDLVELALLANGKRYNPNDGTFS